ncbi:hypothetical protein AMAG_10361 [Allomyces macrogynus ATCC 38327]|uniref:Uncharacterized protein n=1 Tax=Allomyces macrogynus (strain ATCC 38327) TaxID=578462 RepID=A0A0L0SUG4_ALLM3|nr:hypothetical protein AMAG_10361 [Allomyces macrogynus ATCC 38327]|eukprot:KNE66106.1 hypothetical protein AMAG_10361 [Allomyces macrogynus ATCC 38327]
MSTTDFLYDEECQALLAPPSRNLHDIFAPFPVTYQFSQTTMFAAPDRYCRTVPAIGFLADILPLEEKEEAEVEFDEAPYARLVEESDDEWHFEWPTTMTSVPRKWPGVAVATAATQSFVTSSTSVSVGSAMGTTTTSTGVQCVPITTRARLVEVADALVDAVLREVAREAPPAAAEMMAQVEAETDDDVATCVGDDDHVMEEPAVARVATAVARPASPCSSVSSDGPGEYEWVDAAEAVE